MSSFPVCLFHDRRYSCITQRILNLIRKNIITFRYDLNMIGKKWLCTCKVSDEQLAITDEQLIEIQEKFEQIKSDLQQLNQWSDELDRLLEQKIKTCGCKISIYKFHKLICDICDENFPSQMTGTVKKKGKDNSIVNPSGHHTGLVRCRIELSLSPNQVGHLIGHKGHRHKSIMNETETRIHFDNIPYSISSREQVPEFDLDLFQSSCFLRATITGNNLESVQNAIKALEEHVRVISGL